MDADLGGTDGWGAVHPPDINEPVFPEPWHGRTFALTLAANQLVGGNLDAFRYALERLDRSAYLDEGYYGRWFNGAELLLVDATLLAPAAVEARARNLRGEHVEEPPIPPRVDRDYRRAADGSFRALDVAPVFAVGQRVRAKNATAARHTRLARYARGHTGVITIVEPASVFPDTSAVYEGENPQYVYTVEFDSRELWGADAEAFTVTMEMFESYLEDA
jgi:nitrile hydratase